MSLSVTDALSTPAAAAATASPSPTVGGASTTSGFVLSTVDLSETAQALSLQQQGESPSEIAQSLGVSVATVDGYLGIPVPVAATPVQAAPATQSASPKSVEPAKG